AQTLPSSITPSQSLSTPSQTSVVGVQMRPVMLTAPQLHFDPVPGSVPSSFRHVPPIWLSQLVQVPASTVPSPFVSVHLTLVVKVKVVKRQVPPPLVQGPLSGAAFPHGSVFCAYTSPHTSVG